LIVVPAWCLAAKRAETVRRHLTGKITIGLYAINPETQCSKWVAIDGDYKDAYADLRLLGWELKQDGVEALVEMSRRGDDDDGSPVCR
jgi:hypothetical protein